jgi:hypothetical protein
MKARAGVLRKVLGLLRRVVSGRIGHRINSPDTAVMELIVAAETKTGQLASDAPQAVFATVTSQDETPSRCSLADASADKPNPETIRRVHLQIEIVGLERVTEELQTLAQRLAKATL